MKQDKLIEILKELGIQTIKNINQYQFNGLVENFKYLDQNTVRGIIQNIPDLSDKISSYFKEIQAGFEMTKGREFLETMKEQQQILLQLQQQQDDPEIKRMVADELLEHSKWLRSEAVTNRKFNMGMAVGCVIVASIFFLRISKNLNFNIKNAEINPRYHRNSDISPYDISDQYDLGNSNYPDMYNSRNPYTDNNYGLYNQYNGGYNSQSRNQRYNKVDPRLFDETYDVNSENRFKNENIPMNNEQEDGNQYSTNYKNSYTKGYNNVFQVDSSIQELQNRRQNRVQFDVSMPFEKGVDKTIEPLI